MPATTLRTEISTRQGPPRVTLGEGCVRLHNPALFGPGLEAEGQCARFLDRAFRLAGARSVTIDRESASATVRHDPDPADQPSAFLRKLATALAAEPARIPAAGLSLPPMLPSQGFTLHRHGAVLSFCEVADDQPDRLVLRHDGIRRDRVAARRVERLLESVPGVRRVSATRSGTIILRYDSAELTLPRLLRMVERALEGPDAWARSLPEPKPVPFAMANTTLAIAVVGELAIPALLPVSAVLLVGTNLKTFREAWSQARRRELGLPVLYTTIIGATLASGQFVSSSLMSWAFRYWHDRHRRDVAAGQHQILDSCVPLPAHVRLVAADGSELLVAAERLRVGDLFAVSAGEPVPADGKVVSGEGAVDERNLRGREGAAPRAKGDELLAGSVVLAGEFRVAVTRTGEETRAAAIGRALIGATSPDPGETAPTRHAEDVASKAVGPTLATAGLGLLVGDLAAASAILRPDYATGPALVVPLETLRDVAACARRGMVVRDPHVFAKLGSVRMVVLDDLPWLSRTGLEVASIEPGRLPEAEVLRYAASTLRHLDDDRAEALADECAKRKIHLLDLEAIDLRGGVTVREGRHVVKVRGAGGKLRRGEPVVVEVDGEPVGNVSFRGCDRPEAARVVRRVRDLSGSHVVLVSERPRAEAAALGAAIGVNQVVAGLTPATKADFLRGCRRLGAPALFVGDCTRDAGAASAADIAVGQARPEGLDAAPVVLLGDRLIGLDALWDVARGHAERVRTGQALVVVPNMAIIAGAFLFGFTGLTAVAVSNLGTFTAYNRASGSLRRLDRPRPAGRWHQSRL